ncbi:hypothetical protein [Chryseobacterium sp.]|uniref:hypothetical protein n=1 Tax=Chryseobacterium sp. TaxID=1871047 RepID=UPI0028979B3E|nr:hypothetical protein [Chryseobacterium sp.]
MKIKLFLGLAGAVAFFNSCSSDNYEMINPSADKLLLSKITTTYYDDPTKPKTEIETLEYNSQGELIRMQSEAGRNSTFEYSNGKPVKINYYNNKQILEYYLDFTYKGDQLTGNKAVYPNSNSNRTYNYTYNANGQLISSTLCQSADCSKPGTTTYTYSGNNVSLETSSTGGNYSITDKSEYTYDNKLSPFINTNKYLKIMMGRAMTLSENNYLTDKNSFQDSDGSWKPSETTKYTLEYNNAGLPVQATGIGSDGNLSVKYNYEYIIAQ